MCVSVGVHYRIRRQQWNVNLRFTAVLADDSVHWIEHDDESKITLPIWMAQDRLCQAKAHSTFTIRVLFQYLVSPEFGAAIKFWVCR